jgi:hypothetical protein
MKIITLFNKKEAVSKGNYPLRTQRSHKAHKELKH